jgi:hypothetical protein
MRREILGDAKRGDEHHRFGAGAIERAVEPLRITSPCRGVDIDQHRLRSRHADRGGAGGKGKGRNEDNAGNSIGDQARGERGGRARRRNKSVSRLAKFPGKSGFEADRGRAEIRKPVNRVALLKIRLPLLGRGKDRSYKGKAMIAGSPAATHANSFFYLKFE